MNSNKHICMILGIVVFFSMSYLIELNLPENYNSKMKLIHSYPLSDSNIHYPLIRTDRPMYKPGDSVYIQLFQYNPLSHEFVNCSNMFPYHGGTTTLKILNSQDAVIHQEVIQSGNCENSSYLVTYQIPKKTKGGIYYVEISSHRFSKFKRAFRVKDYSKPTMNVIVDFDKENYFPGDTAYAKIHAQSVSGENSNLSKWKFKITTTIEGERKNIEGKLDHMGNGFVSFEIPKSATSDGYFYLVVSPHNGENFSKVFPIGISKRHVNIDFIPETGYLVEGVENWIYFYAYSDENQPLEFEGELFEVGPQGEKEYMKEIYTTHYGKGIFSFLPQPDHYYQIQIKYPGNKTQTIQLPITDKNIKGSFHVEKHVWEDEPLIISFSKQPSVSDLREIRIYNKHQLLFNQTLHNNTEEIQINPSQIIFPSGGVLSIDLVINNSFIKGETLIFKKPSETIGIKIETEKQKYSIGEQVKGTISLFDKKTKEPLQGFINIIVSDISALLEMEKKKLPPTLPTMALLEKEIYRNNSENEVYYSNEYIDYMFAQLPSEEFNKDPDFYNENINLLLGIQNWRRFIFLDSDTFWRMSEKKDDLNIMNLLLGNSRSRFAYAFEEDEEIEEEENGIRMKGFTPIKNQKMLFGGGGRRPMVPLAFNAGDGKPIMFKEESAPHSMTHKKKSKSREDKKSEGYLRKDFTETVYVATAAQTDKNGEYEFVFSLPDTIGQFKIQADGFTMNGRMGIQSQILNTYKDFYLNYNLPSSLVFGDLMELEIYLHNSQNVDLDVQILSKLDHQTQIMKETQVSNHSTSTLKISMNATKEGEFPFEITALGTDKNGKEAGYDSVRKNIRITPSGLKQIETHSGTIGNYQNGDSQNFSLTIPQDAIHKLFNLKVQLYPTPAASLIEAMESLIKNPHGCFEQTSSTAYPLVMALQYLLSHTKDEKSIKMIMEGKEKLKKGYEKLITFEASNGGYEWFGHNPGHEALTAYGLMEFHEIGQILQIDNSMMKRVTSWIDSQRDGTGSFQLNKKSLDSFGRAPEHITLAYIVWSLTLLGYKNLDLEIDHLIERSHESNDPYYLSLIALSLLNLQKNQEISSILHKIMKQQAETGEFKNAVTSITSSSGKNLLLETTALSLLALMESQNIEALQSIENGMKFIISSIKDGKWGTTQSTILCLKALIKYDSLRAGIQGNGKFYLKINGEKINEYIPFDSNSQETIDFHDILSKYSLSDKISPGEDLNVELIMTDYIPDQENTAIFKVPYLIQFEYFTRNLPNTNENSDVSLLVNLTNNILKVNELALFEIQITNRLNKQIGMTLGVISFPPSLKPNFEELEKLKAKNIIDHFEIDFEKNEIILYWRGMSPNQERKLNLGMEILHSGNYTCLPSKAYNYYNDDFQFYSSFETLKIIA